MTKYAKFLEDLSERACIAKSKLAAKDEKVIEKIYNISKLQDRRCIREQENAEAEYQKERVRLATKFRIANTTAPYHLPYPKELIGERANIVDMYLNKDMTLQEIAKYYRTAMSEIYRAIKGEDHSE